METHEGETPVAVAEKMAMNFRLIFKNLKIEMCKNIEIDWNSFIGEI